MRKHELTLLVLEILDIDFYGVTGGEVGIVAELAYGDDTVALGTDADNHFTLADADDGTVGHLVLVNMVEGFIIGSFCGLLVYFCSSTGFKGVPVKFCKGSNVFKILHCNVNG